MWVIPSLLQHLTTGSSPMLSITVPALQSEKKPDQMHSKASATAVMAVIAAAS